VNKSRSRNSGVRSRVGVKSVDRCRKSADDLQTKERERTKVSYKDVSNDGYDEITTSDQLEVESEVRGNVANGDDGSSGENRVTATAYRLTKGR
jgi:hypothetical protein